ncbi:hypothetical protein BZG36_04669 [Bifiguratus adelaidae]|uniref:G-patch domain-containing protein n=1 Tax=Bifiguratus adelaidae TaxID=1938954 RepID=A0A261XWL1_9FUNG|nr:hypothetical protein BZG36_04669 [Bifiguratus adelaidae]
MDDMDSSNSEDEDMESFEVVDRNYEEEAAGFGNFRKRRKFTKEDAMLGIFNEEEDEYDGRDTRRRPVTYSGVSFVKSQSKGNREGQDTDMAGSSESEGSDVSSGDESAEPVRVPRKQFQESDEEDTAAPIGGLGFAKGQTLSMDSLNQTPQNIPERSDNAALRSMNQNAAAALRQSTLNGSSTRAPPPLEMPAMQFGSSKGKKPPLQSRQSGGSPAGWSTPPSQASRPGTPPVSVPKDFAKFNAHGSGFGLKMLQKMGWQAGTGLGQDGAGIVNPVETKLRPGRMGLAYKGFTEMTEQHKEEARRRGEIVDDTPQDVGKSAKRAAWKKKPEGGEGRRTQTARKITKTVYKTANDILSTTSSRSSSPSLAQQKIIDMTGPDARELSAADLQQLRSQTPTGMEMSAHIPELRHNIRLLVDMSRSDLDHLRREQRITNDKLSANQRDQASVEDALKQEEHKLSRFSELQALVDTIVQRQSTLLQQVDEFLTSDGIIDNTFGDIFLKLAGPYLQEYEDYGVDSFIASIWTTILRRQVTHWSPLDNPTLGVADICKWRVLLKTSWQPPPPDVDMDAAYLLGRPNRNSKPQDLRMTGFESMLHHLWLPKIRSAVNNAWDPHESEPLIKLLTAWKPPMLPQFIFENIVDQLILPKLARAVNEWDPRNDDAKVHTWLHPWLPILGYPKLQELYTSVRQKFSITLRQWHPSDTSAFEVIYPWKDVWEPAEMETFLIKSVLPKLVHVLRTEFQVNPQDQQLDPLQWVMLWTTLLSPVINGQLLENEFFPKWLDMIYRWLTADQESADLKEVADWYEYWKSAFQHFGVYNNPSVQKEFRKGLEMMATAVNGGKVVMPPVGEASRLYTTVT